MPMMEEVEESPVVVRDFFKLERKGTPRGSVETVVDTVEAVEPFRVEPAGEVASEVILPFQES
jgi:hypothetical protein